jgi:HSP20 family protein
MPLIPWKAFSDLDKFFEDDGWLMPILPSTEISKPAMDIYETDKEVIAEVSIPNFDPKKIDVSVESGILKVSGKIDKKAEKKEKGYWRKEIRKGSFERMVRLPIAVKEKSTKATYEKGVLKIVMPKAEAKSSSKVKVQIKGK